MSALSMGSFRQLKVVAAAWRGAGGDLLLLTPGSSPCAYVRTFIPVKNTSFPLRLDMTVQQMVSAEPLTESGSANYTPRQLLRADEASTEPTEHYLPHPSPSFGLAGPRLSPVHLPPPTGVTQTLLPAQARRSPAPPAPSPADLQRPSPTPLPGPLHPWLSTYFVVLCVFPLQKR